MIKHILDPLVIDTSNSTNPFVPQHHVIGEVQQLIWHHVMQWVRVTWPSGRHRHPCPQYIINMGRSLTNTQSIYHNHMNTPRYNNTPYTRETTDTWIAPTQTWIRHSHHNNTRSIDNNNGEDINRIYGYGLCHNNNNPDRLSLSLSSITINFWHTIIPLGVSTFLQVYHTIETNSDTCKR